MAVENTINPLVRTSVQACAANVTNGAYAFSIGGVYAGAYDVGSIAVSNGQNAIITFAGTGADNSTFTCQIWSRTDLSDQQGDGDGAFLIQYVGLATITLSALTGVSVSTVLPTTMRIADSIVWAPATTGTTPAGNYSDLAAALGYTTGTASSAGGANLMPATLTLPTLGEACTLLFDFKLGTATAMNAFAQVNVV